MKKCFVLLMMVWSSGYAQEAYVGVNQGNKSGLLGIISNPAMAGNRKWEATTSLYQGAINTALGIRIGEKYKIYSPKIEGLYEFDLLLPSFMINIYKGHSVGVLLRERSVAGILTDTKEFIKTGASIVKYGNRNALFQAEEGFTDVWSEIGLWWSAEVFHQDFDIIKLGITAKKLSGIINRYVDKSNGSFHSEAELATLNDINPIENNKGKGFGTDMGVVYEHYDRRKRANRCSDCSYYDGYKYRVGVSLLDWGSIRYKRKNEDEFYTVQLPTRVRVAVDYFLQENFFISVSGQWPIFSKNRPIPSSKYVPTLTLTPRYEGNRLDLYLPITYTTYTYLNCGLAFQYRMFSYVSFFMGSSNLISSSLYSSKQIELFFGFRVGR